MGEGSRLAGRPLIEIETEHPFVRVVALKRGDDPVVILPDRTLGVRPGDHVIAIGSREHLTELANSCERL